MSIDAEYTPDSNAVKRFQRARELQGGRYARYEEYTSRYENEYEPPVLTMRMDEKVRPFVSTVNWCRLCIESLANRMSIAGFITSLDKDRAIDENGEPVGVSIDEKLWDWWQAANMDKESRLAHTEALLQGIAYVIVNLPKGQDHPEFILGTSRNMYATYDPRTREVQEAYQWYNSMDDDTAEVDRGVVYTKNEIIPLVRSPFGDWEVDREGIEPHNLGIVPVAPIVNRAKVGDRNGRSEITDIIPLSDFATRLMTNAQLAQEILAMPLRHVSGMSQEDFVGPDGTPTPQWKAYFSSLLVAEDPQAKFGQMPGADLRNFTDMFNMLAKQVSSVSGLPPHALGLTTSNPASAEAIRSGESNLVMRIMDRSAAFEQGWELAMRIALIWDGYEEARTMRIETTWNNPETPTYTSKADAVTKLRGMKIIPNVQAMEDLGYSPEKIRKNQQLLREEAEQEMGFNWGTAGSLNDQSGLPEASDDSGQGAPPTRSGIADVV